MIKKTSLIALALTGAMPLFANVRLPRLFSNNMVIQRDQSVAVWGWADPGEKVTVTFDHQSKAVKADKKGNWMIHLDPEVAGGPFELTVKGKNQLVCSDVLVGEVWLCSGQSNMEMPIAGWGQINNYEQEIAAANYPQIRHFKVPNTVATAPQQDIPDGDWKVCSPATAGDFSATAYFFARTLFEKLHVPIGLINSSWGGTMVETWASHGAFEQSDEFKGMIAGLPDANGLTNMINQKKEALIKKVNALQGGLPAAGEEASYKDPAYNDGQWPHMSLPGLWEDAKLGLDNLDGIVWFRRTVDIADADAGKPAILQLGMIDDMDETYVNGVKVGGINGYNTPRQYDIPAGVLKGGKNVIAVRVTDGGGGGGIYGDPGTLQYKINGKATSLTGDWSFKVVSVAVSNYISPNAAPTLLYNAMINPLIPYTFKGVIWYQGEANAGRAYQYRKAFPLMISDWRHQWKSGDFPFYFVQLASWNANNGNSQVGSAWAELREAQAMTLSLPNTGMAVTTDIGNAQNIHPKNKQDVGKRLALMALHNQYGQSLEYSGPRYESMTVDGNKVILHFSHIGSGLAAFDKYGYLKGFEVAGDDQHFHYAKATIQGNTVVVWQEDVQTPVAVRYGWADDAGEDNLFNKEGLPAGPFRTDQWKGVTEDKKYELGK